MMSHSNDVAMVLGHGDHEVFLTGMIQQFQPHILYITCGPHAENDLVKKQARAVLKSLAFRSTVTFLPVTEAEIFQHMLSDDSDWFERYRDQVAAWLNKVRPDVIFSDAYEWYNSVHDLCPLLVDSALQATASLASHRPARYDLPLAFQTIPYRRAEEFDNGGTPFEYCSLTPEQTRQKRAIVRTQSLHDANIREVTAGWPSQRYEQEVYRRVPAERDYRIAPCRDLWVTYDEHGTNQVRSGRYAQAISFQEHYAPIANALFSRAFPYSRGTVSKVA